MNFLPPDFWYYVLTGLGGLVVGITIGTEYLGYEIMKDLRCESDRLCRLQKLEEVETP